MLIVFLRGCRLLRSRCTWVHRDKSAPEKKGVSFGSRFGNAYSSGTAVVCGAWWHFLDGATVHTFGEHNSLHFRKKSLRNISTRLLVQLRNLPATKPVGA